MANEFIPYSESFYETTLTNSMTAVQTSMVVATAPTNQSGYLVVEPKSSNREIVKYTSASGTTLTVLRGLSETSNYDDSAGTGVTHAAGVQVAMKDVHYYFNKVTAAYRGEEVTGYNSFYMGDGNAVSTENRFWYAACSSVSAFWGLSSDGQLVISEDGVTSWTISAGGSGVTAGDGITITAGVVDVDLLSTGGLELSAATVAVGVSSLLARDANGLRVDTTSAMDWSGIQTFDGGIDVATDKLSVNSVAILATAAEINQAVSGTSAYADNTPYNFSTLLDGSDVTDKHHHDLAAGVGNATDTKGYWNFVLPLPVDNLSTTNYTPGSFLGALSGGPTADTSHSCFTPNGLFLSENSNNPYLGFNTTKKVICEFGLIMDGVGGGEQAGWGLMQGSNPFEDIDETSVDACTFGITSASNLYAHNANAGVGGQDTSLSAVSLNLSALNTYRIEFDPGVDVKFYINAALVATHTTNLPDGTRMRWGFGGTGTTNNEYVCGVTQPWFAVEK